VNALCEELTLRQSYLKTSDPVETIYFGGGTPSVLGSTHLQYLFDTLNHLFDLSQCKEITLEANPDDLSENYLHMLSHFPINRLSIGIQSLHDNELQLLNRRHSAQEAIEAVKRTRHYISNISIDLMFGLPLQTLASWNETIEKSVELHVQHISAYQLTLEKGTKLYRQKELGKVLPASDELSTEMYFMLVQKLADAGFEQYEISNFSLPSYASKHNSAYWQEKCYLGVGPSAHSFNGISRQWNVANNKHYLNGIGKGDPEIEQEQLTETDHYNEKVMTALRTKTGIDLSAFEKQFGNSKTQQLLQAADKYLSTGLLKLQEDHLHLTTESFWISDGIITDLMIEDND
jgi:oxygen-independent coproporphyrinogen-3 oxidase